MIRADSIDIEFRIAFHASVQAAWQIPFKFGCALNSRLGSIWKLILNWQIDILCWKWPNCGPHSKQNTNYLVRNEIMHRFELTFVHNLCPFLRLCIIFMIQFNIIRKRTVVLPIDGIIEWCTSLRRHNLLKRISRMRYFNFRRFLNLARVKERFCTSLLISLCFDMTVTLDCLSLAYTYEYQTKYNAHSIVF